MRLADWPRTPYLNDEVREWARQQLVAFGVDEIAIFAVEVGTDGDERRILTATEIGLLDMYYAPAGSSARFSLTTRLYPWQAVRGVDLRVETFRLWALEDRSRWLLRIGRPRFSYNTEMPEMGRCLTEFARVAAIMAEPSGWQPPSDDASAMEIAPPELSRDERPKPAPSEQTVHVAAAEPPAADDEEPPAEDAQPGSPPPDEEEIAFVEPADAESEDDREQRARRGFLFPRR